MNLCKIFLLALLPGLAAAQTPVQVSDFKVPDGFSVELITKAGVVERPMLASFDDRGRLYVCDSGGMNLRGDDLVKASPNCIRRLEDTDGDGIFDKSTLFADKMVFPQGIVWHAGSVYVSSPPNFWRLEDTDDDGVADKREILATGFPLTGISDDMHGGSLGPDGRLYFFCGRFPHEIRRPGGPIIHKGRSPLMVRCLPDGSELEMVSGTHGNCVGAAFTPEGEPFACGTFYADDSMGAGLRDAIIHIVEGGDYPIRGMVLNELKRTGELMPPLTHLGVAAAAGMTIYRDGAFGAGYEGNLFSALFNMHKVVRHVIERDGASFKSHNVDFLTSTNSDFHPTDVLEDADGSLLVVNTGAWFLNGCPTSQVSKPEVHGGIYRIRRKGAPVIADPRGLKIAWASAKPAELTPLLSDGRFAVRDHAIKQLAVLGDKSIAALKQTLTSDKSVEARRNAIWTLTRMTPPASETARIGLADKDASVQQTTARALGTVHDVGAIPRLLELVRTAAPPLRREAATALGRLRPPEAVTALLEGMRGGGDRFMEHALIFALIQINDAPATQKGLADADPSVRRGALIALDQMDSGKLTAAATIPFLNEADSRLQQAAFWVISRHSDWAKAMRSFFGEWLAKENRDENENGQLRQQLLAFGNDASIQDLVAKKLSDPGTSVTSRLLLLETMGQMPVHRLPEVWGKALVSSLAQPDDRVVRQTVATLRSLPIQRRLVLKRLDANINFSPPAKQPFPGTRLTRNFFTRWTGLIKVPQSGAYAFTIEADDAARVLLDGKNVLDNTGPKDKKQVKGSVELTEGVHAFEVDYLQTSGEMRCAISWAPPGKAIEVIPAAALFHHRPGDEEETAAPLVSGLAAEFYDLSGERVRFIDPDKNTFAPPLLAVALNPKHEIPLRVEALAAVAPLIARMDQPAFEFLTGCLAETQPPLVRLAAADALGRATLGKAQLLALSQVLPKLGSLETARVIAAFERSQNSEVGRSLVAALEKSANLNGLRAEALEAIVKNYPPKVAQAAAPLLKRLSQNREQQQAHLAELKSVLSGGDIQRGRELFFGNKAICFTCHTVQGRGGHVGPDLSKIGEIRAGGDLLEAIVYPSASFARGFEPFNIITKDGEVYSAIIGRETPDAIYTYDGARVETRIARANIKELRPGTVSIMPQGLDSTLSKAELGDLIAFLRSLR